MNIRNWTTFHSVFILFIGLAFLLYSPLVMAWMGFDRLVQDSQGYWAMVSFARLFGMGLLAWGLTLVTVQKFLIVGNAGEQSLKKLLATMAVGDWLAAFTGAIQSASVWGIASGWMLSGGFGLLGSISLILLLLSKRRSD